MDGWSIMGDTEITPYTTGGVTYGLSGAERSFEQMRFSGWELKFQSLAADTFTYTIKTENAKGKGAIVPFDGQEIHVYHNGIRRFKGWVIKPKLGLTQLSITAVGPWHFATKISLSGESLDESGGKVNRTTYGFPEQGMQTTLRTLIDRAEAMGVPWRKFPTDATAGEIQDRIATMFTFGKTTLSNISFAAAISYFMENVGDAVAWFDYTTGGAPELIISRRAAVAAGKRSTMDPITYEVGATGTTRVVNADIYPRTDQKVAAVRVNYAQRQLGKTVPKWATQRAGFGDAALDADEKRKRRVQIITWSGPEKVDLTPSEKQEAAYLQTLSGPDPTSAFVSKRAGTISSLISSNGKYGAVGRYVSGYDGTSWEVAKYIGYDFGPVRVLNPDGTKAATTGKYLLISTSIPEWFSKAPFYAKKVKITGTWISTWSWGDGYTETDPPPAGWMAWYTAAPSKDLWWRSQKVLSSDMPVNKRWFAIPWELEAVLVSTVYTTRTLVWKPLEWDYYPPPENLADNLYDAQNWLPFEGPVTLRRPDLNGYNGLQRKFNLTNAHPDYEDMDALVRSVSFRGPNTVVWDLGAPPRIDSAGLVNKMRRSGQDNIQWL